MKKILALTTILMMAILGLQAQEKKPVITFEKSTHDFGSFEEAMGPVTTEFKFKNTGNAPLLITRTAASCGCTTPRYPKEPIAPGGEGVIKVTYNPKGRPGVFQKTVYVMANTEPTRTKLIIKGNVKGDERSKKALNYRARVGNLHIKSRYLPMFDVLSGTTKTEAIEVYNSGNEGVLISFANVPEHLTVTASPSILPADSEGKIEITYDADRAEDWGLRKDMFNVLLGSSKEAFPNNQIIVSAEIREDFNNLTEKERANAPQITINEKLVNFGATDVKKEMTVMIQNTGKSDLIIRKVANQNEAFSFDLTKKRIKPGKDAELKVTFDPQLAKARNLTSQLQVISNDPNEPTELIRLRASVK